MATINTPCNSNTLTDKRVSKHQGTKVRLEINGYASSQVHNENDESQPGSDERWILEESG